MMASLAIMYFLLQASMRMDIFESLKKFISHHYFFGVVQYFELSFSDFMMRMRLYTVWIGIS